MTSASSQTDYTDTASGESEEEFGLDRAQQALGRMAEVQSELKQELSSPVFSIPVTVKVVIGTARLPISELLDLEIGSSVELDQKIGDPVDLVVNDQVIARGELSVSEGADPQLFVTVVELLNARKG